ncbi:MAG TPA: tetratricopeptide repeat protein [Terriglobales bacterium]|nr:tetratricopeptide repeat protein [Terriglobales bacterium]
MIRALVLLFLAWQSPSPEALQHMQAGAEAEKNRHFDVAIAEYRKVTELEPTLAAGFVSLGQAYLENHDYGGAIVPLKQAVTLSPELRPAHQLLGYALLAEGYAAQAIPHLEKAQDTAALGIAQLETGDFAGAVPNLQAALSQRPNDPDLLYYFGRASGLLSKQSIDTLLAAYPDSARAHQAMAENYYILRQMPQAEKEFLEAIRQRPDIPKLHLELGLVYAGSAQWPKAEEAFRAETKLQPGNAEAAYRLGNALLQQGKTREGRAELIRSDKLQPEMPETLYALGKADSLEGDATAAEKAWKKVIELEQTSRLTAQAHFALAGLYRKQGKADAAQQEMEAFKKLEKTSTPPEAPQQ